MKVLLIGDSISLDYGRYLRDFVRHDIEIYGKPGVEEAYQDLDQPIGGNGGDSNRVLAYIKELYEAEQLSFDYFVFNCGLHDIKRNGHGVELQVTKERYISNLEYIIAIMKAKCIKTIFINTTPADESRYSNIHEFIRYNDDVVAYNKLAQNIMRTNGITIINLYAFTESLGAEGDDLFRDHTHFLDNIIRLQAAYIAGALNSIL